MKKYFAYDALEHEFTTHDTLQEAKSKAQDCVDEIFDIGADNGFGDEIEDGIKETCFGVVLGGFDLPTRPLTKEEEDSYGEYTHMVENPVLVEYPQNGWIKCSERLPEIFAHNGLERSDVVMCFGTEEQDDPKTYFLAYRVHGNRFYGFNGACEQVTHWQPLPKPPID